MTEYNYNNEVFQCSKIERQLINITTLALFLGLIFPVINNGSAISNLVSFFCTFFIIIAIVLFYNINGRPKIIYTVTLFVFVTVYMLIIGALGGSIKLDRAHFLFVWSNDLRYVLLFWLGGLFACSEKYMSYFHLITYKITIASVFLGIIGVLMWARLGFSILRGENSNKLLYYFWYTQGACVISGGYYGIMNKRKRLWFLAALFLYFVLGLAFLKRAAFVDVIVIVVLSLYLQSKNGNFHNLLGVVLLVGVFVLILGFSKNDTNSWVTLLFSRFTDSAKDIDSFDRLIEWRVYQENTSLFDKLRGFGIGNYLYYVRYGVGKEETFLNALHLGYANIIYKGGVLYALFYIVLYWRVFMNWFHCHEKSLLYLVCFGVSVSSLISLSFGGSWNYQITPFFVSAPVFYASSIRNK